MARDTNIFDMVQNVRGRNEIPKKRKPKPRDDYPWTDEMGWVSPGVAGYQQTPYQEPGTSGLSDLAIGGLYESNPEWFGSGDYQWNQLSDIGNDAWMWQQYLDALEGGADLQEMFANTDLTPEFWMQQEAAYDFWNSIAGPGGTSGPNYSGPTNIHYSDAPSGGNYPVWGSYGPGHVGGFSNWPGGGQQGGAGDLGTGSAFAGGSMSGTMTGEGLWDYDCATQGPLYNSQGECIACCE